MPSISVNGINVNFTESGSGDPIVMVHGGAATNHYWNGVSIHLVDQYLLVAIDLYGCGETDPWPETGAAPQAISERHRWKTLACGCHLPQLSPPHEREEDNEQALIFSVGAGFQIGGQSTGRGTKR